MFRYANPAGGPATGKTVFNVKSTSPDSGNNPTKLIFTDMEPNSGKSSSSSQENNIRENIIMLADPYLSFTKLIGAEVDRNSKGMGIRSSRYAMIINNLEVQNIQEEEETKNCGISSAGSILNII